MSMQQKLLAAAQAAAIEATTNERARCLWCIDKLVTELKDKLANTIVHTAVQTETIKLKLKIAQAFASEVRRAIVSGIRPTNGQGPGAADFSKEKTDG